ncbi:hypothetical protein NFI96_021812 [Prochilodus magdalenae]|nr:hypothetical protein NFI96_021812 [Prochilodus magdalenae]
MDMEFSPLQRSTGRDTQLGRQIATVIDSCWVTPVNDQNYAVRWDLIINSGYDKLHCVCHKIISGVQIQMIPQ